MKKLSIAMEIMFALERLQMDEDISMKMLMDCPKDVLALLLAETHLLLNLMNLW